MGRIQELSSRLAACGGRAWRRPGGNSGLDGGVAWKSSCSQGPLPAWNLSRRSWDPKQAPGRPVLGQMTHRFLCVPGLRNVQRNTGLSLGRASPRLEAGGLRKMHAGRELCLRASHGLMSKSPGSPTLTRPQPPREAIMTPLYRLANQGTASAGHPAKETLGVSVSHLKNGSSDYPSPTGSLGKPKERIM